MPPEEFERLVGVLLEQLGYQNVQVTGKRSDGGVDLVANRDLGLGSVRILIQVKRWKRNVPVEVIRELRGCLGPGDRGVVVTTSSFTPAAQATALEAGRTPVWLVDGQQVIDLLVEIGIGVRKQRLLLLELEHPSALPSKKADDAHDPLQHRPRLSRTPSGRQITAAVAQHFARDRSALLPVFAVLAGAVLHQSATVDYFAITRHIVFVVGDEREQKVVMLLTVQSRRLELRLRLPSTIPYCDRLRPCEDKAWRHLKHRVYLSSPNEVDDELRQWIGQAII